MSLETSTSRNNVLDFILHSGGGGDLGGFGGEMLSRCVVLHSAWQFAQVAALLLDFLSFFFLVSSGPPFADLILDTLFVFLLVRPLRILFLTLFSYFFWSAFCEPYS